MKVTAHATRSGGWWAVAVPEVDGVFTQAKRLDQIPAAVADAVATMEDVDPATVVVDVLPDLEGDIGDIVNDVLVERARLEHEREAAAAQLRDVVTRLQDAGYTMRDIGVLLDVSYQRVGQLSGAAAAKKSVAATQLRRRQRDARNSKTVVRQVAKGRFVATRAAANSSRDVSNSAGSGGSKKKS